MKSSFIVTSVLLLISASTAFAGVGAGGGGDLKTEGRIDEIRSDLLKWISEGGAKRLELSQGTTYEAYVKTMEDFLRPQEVVVTAIKTSEENPNDDELSVRVDGQPKTCKGFFSKKDHRPHILCNVERFWETSEADQYRLVHHEYAGLALLEKNYGAASDYSISRQITDFLVPVTVLRLAVKNNRSISEEMDARCTISLNFGISEERKKEKQYEQILENSNSLAGAFAPMTTYSKLSKSEKSKLKAALRKRGYQISGSTASVFNAHVYNVGVKEFYSENYVKFEDYQADNRHVSTRISARVHYETQLKITHRKSKISKSLTSKEQKATHDLQRASHLDKINKALTVNEYQAAKNEYESIAFNDLPALTSVERLVTDLSNSIPSCADFYGKKVLTDSEK